MSKSTADNMQSVSSNAVYNAMPKFVHAEGTTNMSGVKVGWDIIEFGTWCLCIGLNSTSFTPSTGIAFYLPTGYTFEQIVSANVFCSTNVNWVTGTSHYSGNGAYTYITGNTRVEVGCMRQIVIASKN